MTEKVSTGNEMSLLDRGCGMDVQASPGIHRSQFTEKVEDPRLRKNFTSE